MTSLKSLFTFFLCLMLSLSNVAQAEGYKQIQWVDLLPEEDMKALLETPDSDIPEGSAIDQINSPLSMTIEDPVSAYEKALISVKVKGEFDKKKIKLPGYIVPVDLTEDGKITSFFLVPFFGACIHLPPPPPNQIIYATYEKGFKLDSIEEPYWIEGTVFTKQQTNDMATAAYSATVDTFYPFKETDDY